MIVPGSANALLLSSSAYTIPYSLRFRASNSANLRKTFSSASTNFDVQTISLWFKRGRLTLTDSPIANCLITQFGPGGNYPTFELGFEPSSDQLVFMNRSASTSYNHRLVTTAQFRDPSAWYHLVIAYDSSLATSTDRIKMWINGVQITSFSTATYPAQNLDSQLANNTYSQPADIGSFANGSRYFDGYMAEVNFIDGQALTPSSFGQTDSATGVWVPKKYSGTYGTNGFYLKFADASAATAAAIGKDSSGNGNNFTPSGISVTSGVTFDQMTDTPTLNYSVLNPLDLSGTAGTYSAANLNYTKASGGNAQAYSSITMASGKWYCEVTMGADFAEFVPGIIAGSANAGANRYLGQDSFTYAYYYDGRKINSASFSAYGNSYVSGDVIGIILDADNGKLYFSKNGTVQASGDPVAGTNAAFTGLTGPYRFAVSAESSGIGDFNFGQRAFAYTPPTGFKALNTTNLPTPSIKKGSLYMDATLRTGTGATTSVSTLGFQPDWVWIKSRSNGTAHNLFNSVIGATKGIQTTGPNAQYTDTNTLTAFNANGYSLGSDASSRGVNINTNTYVDWAWKESTTAGLDILSWTGDGTGARTINHALGVTPEFMMLRGTDARVWACWFNSMTSAAYYMDLGTATGELVDTTMFDSTAPTSTTFRVGSYNNVNAVTYVGYFFSSIAGFSNIGSYTGNASTDGPFVFCGFSPKFVMIKGVDIGTGWFMVNPSNSANEVVVRVFSDTTGAELSNTYGLDLLSNGFKVRAPSGYSLNDSGNKYAFIAYAENPFKYARAR